MTWGDWVNSEYDTLGRLEIENSMIVISYNAPPPQPSFKSALMRDITYDTQYSYMEIIDGEMYMG